MRFIRFARSAALCTVMLGAGLLAGLTATDTQGYAVALAAGLMPQKFEQFQRVKNNFTRLFASRFMGTRRLTEPPQGFSYYAPGDLTGRSGAGAASWQAFAPDMAFPVDASQPAFLNSQVYSPGGGGYRGNGPNNQCVRANYTYPWRDNFCERRSGKDRESLNCPSRSIHQGVDIRGGTGGTRTSTCARMAWDEHAPQTLVPVVAVEDGFIEYSLLPHKYVVTLITGKGRAYHYMHLDRASLVQAPGTRVTRGQTIGYLSDYFGRSRTTQHLHFEILQNMAGKGWSHVPPYMSLVRAYERDHGVSGVLVEDEE